MNLALPRRRFLVAILVALSSPVALRAQTAGFAVESQGARATGFAGAYVAQAADPSAIFYNAAGIAFLKGRQLALNGGLSAKGTDFTGEGETPPAGTLEQTERKITVRPSLYYSHQLTERLVAGVGLSSPFAVRSQWKNPDLFTGRTLCTDCEIRAWSLNPTVAYKLEDRLAVGIGLDLRFSRFRLDRRLNGVPEVLPQAQDVAAQTLSSSTRTDFGFNLGLMASPSESLTLGIAYRHRVQAVYAAVADFAQIATGDAALDAQVAAHLPASQTVTVVQTFPSSLTAGLAVRRGDWLIEGDLAWTFWSSFDSVELRYAETPALSASLPQAYETVLGGRLGVQYQLSRSVALRGGYSYDDGPQPSTTLSPFLHDSSRQAFGLGGTWTRGKLSLDFVARYLRSGPRSTGGLSRYGYDGLYETSALELGLGFGYRF
jgi:long-chain fatty acid transport protein